MRTDTHPALYVLFAVVLYFLSPLAARSDDSVWLARSCVGEAGWRAHETGECLALLHLYRKRAALTGETVVELARRYSAAIKRHGTQRNRWVWHLGGASQPRGWPSGVDWQRYVYHWLQTRFVVAMFLQGRTVDPLPAAMHYGCVLDPQPTGTVRMRTQRAMRFRNRFYRLRGRR